MLYSVVLERASHDGWLGIYGMTLLAATGEAPALGKVRSIARFLPNFWGGNKQLRRCQVIDF